MPGKVIEQLCPWIEDRWYEIQEVLDEFHSLLSKRVPRLRIERQVDVLEWEHQNGVYLLFDSSEQLLYVGLTLDRFISRIKRHQVSLEYSYADFIVFPNEFGFLAPALEVLLNQRLVPKLSGHGKHI
jgi:hypothetical protein